MSNKGVGIAFKLTALVLLLGILGVSIGILIVTLNVRDDVEATPEAPTIPTVATPPSTKAPPPTTTAANVPIPPCTNAPPDDPKTDAPDLKTTEEPVDPVDPVEETKNIADGAPIDEADTRYPKFTEISNLYEKWMDLKVDPCDDFYHYVCGKGQKNGESSPFTISQNTDDTVERNMWRPNDKTYWNKASLPVKQARWFRDKCNSDDTYTLADRQNKITELLQQYIDQTSEPVPFFTPDDEFLRDPTVLSKITGTAKGQFGVFALLTTYVATDNVTPDGPSSVYVDQPLPIFIDSVYTDEDYPTKKDQLVKDISDTITQAAQLLKIDLNADALKKMSEDVVEFDRVISRTMQQDATVRRDATRNYNPRALADLNTKVDEFEWISYVQATLSLLGDKTPVVDGTWNVIIMETEILGLLNDHIKASSPATVANYVYYKAFSQILQSVPLPPKLIPNASPLDEYRAVFNRDKRTLTDMLRKVPDQKAGVIRTKICSTIVEALLPWPTSRLYVDQDIKDLDKRAALKKNVAEIANWIFFGFRSQLDQLNWMDTESKKGAFDKLDNLQLNVAFPDWVTDDAQLTAYYKDLDIAEDDNFMNIVLKMTNYMRVQEMLPLVVPTPRDRGDFSSFIGITNAWYQPQMNSITFPEGILQEPFYSPDYPLATIFGGLGAISGHELTHGFDDQGVQWDGIGALNQWMKEDAQTSFNAMAKCVIDEYSSFCPFKPDECVNGENTQGENIADNGGIQAAYKALKAYESLNGADPRLPGFGSTFTSDQLFFLTFAQTWCDAEQSEPQFVNQVKVDVHSPAKYRVLGTIQNFPAFKNAFNCKADTPYTPTKHCDVWTSKPFK